MAVTQQQVAELYVATFNRAPDADGLDYWVNISFNANPTIEQIAASFFDQPETQALYPSGTTDTAFVTAIYLNLFNRAPDAAGLAYWVADLANGVPRSVMIEAVKNGALAGTNLTDKAIILNKAEVALYHASLGLQDTNFSLAGVTAYQSSVDAAKISVDSLAGTASLSLTAGVDTITGTAGNDVINATNTTLTAFDTINGGLGNDALNYTGTAPMNVSPAGLSVSSVETANFRSVGDLTIDTSAWTGLTTANVTQVVASPDTDTTEVNNSTSGDLDLTAAATTNVNVSAVAGYVTVAGGKNVTVNQSSDAGVTVDGATGAVNITTHGTADVTAAMAAVTVAAQGYIYIDGAATAVNASILDAVSLAERTAHEDAANAASDVASTASDAANDASTYASALSSLSGVLAANTTLALNNSDTLNSYQNGVITQAQKVQIDTAFATAYAATVGAASVKEAAAQAAAVAIVTPLLTAANANVVTTADAYTVAEAAATAAWDIVNADWDVNGISSSMEVTSSAASSVTLAGNYGGEDYVNVNDSSLLSNVLTTVTLDNSGAYEVNLNGKALTNVNITDSDIGGYVTVDNATVGHTMNVTVTNSYVDDFYDDVAATVNLTVADTEMWLSADSATALNITSNGTENSVWLNADSATAVKISGAGNLQTWFDGDVAANAVITATTATGDIETGVGVAQSYLGGSGVDTVTVGTALQTATVNGGAGTADKLVLTANANFAGTGAAKFTNFEVLQVNNGVTADASLFTGSTFTSVVSNGATTAINGLNATQAAHVTVMTTSALTLGVTNAIVVGNLDTVHITADDGASTTSTVVLAAPSIAGVETINLTANDNLTVGALTSTAALKNMNIDGAGAVSVTTGALSLNVNTVIDAHAATGTVLVNASSSTANGLAIIGSATAANTLTSNALASVLTGGAGNDTLTGGAGADTITAGNGNNTVIGGAGNNTITLGNGYNTVTTGAGADVITVGTGGNTITAGAGNDTITFGTHGVGTVNTVIFATTASNGIDTVTGFVAGAGSDLAELVAGATTNVAQVVDGVADFATSTNTTLTAGAAAFALTGGNTTTDDIIEINATLSSFGNLGLAGVLDGTELLKALSSTSTAATQLTATASGDNFYVVAYQNGKAYLYQVTNNANTAVVASEIALVSVFNGVAAGTFAAGDFITAAGAPGSNFTLTTANDAFIGGSGNDTFNGLFSNGGTNTFNTGDVLTANGGLGDTLTIGQSIAATAISLDDTFWSGITGIENLVFSDTTDGVQTFTLNNNFNTAFTGGVHLTTNSTAGGINITMGGAVNEAVTLTTTSTGGPQIIDTGAGTGLVTVDAHSTGGGLNISGADIISVTTNSTGGIQSINTSTGTAAVTVNATSTTGAQTITTGAGIDSITTTSTGGGSTITGGAGADSINLTTSPGVDKIIYTTAATSVNAAGLNVDTITDFATTVDKIQLTSGGDGLLLAGVTLVTGNTFAALDVVVMNNTSVATIGDVYVQLATDLAALAASVGGSGTLVAREVTFTTGTAAGTYLVINDSTVGFVAANDLVIHLVGTTAIIAADLTVV